MRANGYIRLSQEDQSNYSLDMQENGIRDYCTRNRLALGKIFTDNGESSYTFDRKEFHELEKEMKATRTQYLVVYHLDRFGRNMAEAMLKIRDYLTKGIKVRDISEPLDLDDEDPNTFLLRSLKFMSAESELHRIRARTKAGIRQAALNGRFAHKAPYGYRNIKDADGRALLEVEEEEATHVRMIFREFLNGVAIEKLHAVAQHYGYRQKGKMAIQRILSNPVYAGLIKVPAAKNQAPKLVKGMHTALISEQDYWLAQDRYNKKIQSVHSNEEIPLRGVLHCWCGRKLTAGNSRSKSGKYFWYYLCNEHRKGLSAIKLHTQFEDLLANLSYDDRSLAEFKERLSQRLTDHLSNREKNTAEVRKQLTTIENKMRTAEEKYLGKADISEATYTKVMNEYRAERSRLYGLLSGYNTNQQAYWDMINATLLSLADVRASYNTLSVFRKHQFINTVFDSSLIYENGIYRTPYIFPIFNHNLQALNEKGLLKISSPIVNLGEAPCVPVTGPVSNTFEPVLDDIDKLFKIFVA